MPAGVDRADDTFVFGSRAAGPRCAYPRPVSPAIALRFALGSMLLAVACSSTARDPIDSSTSSPADAAVTVAADASIEPDAEDSADAQGLPIDADPHITHDDARVTSDASPPDAGRVATALDSCRTDVDCGGAAPDCLDAFPEPFCSGPCTFDAECGREGFCVERTCRAACFPWPTRCDRFGGYCREHRFEHSYCVPSCTVAPSPGAPSCPPELPCDPYSGECTATPTRGAPNGAPCTVDADCRGGICFPEYVSGALTGYPGGMCRSWTRRPANTDFVRGQPPPQSGCPPGSAAIRGDALEGTPTHCLPACARSSDCREGYTCSTETALGPYGYCVPGDCRVDPSVVCGAGRACHDEPALGSSFCAPCTRDCAGHNCGDDGCGGSCGTCVSTQQCNLPTGVCECAPACSGRSCGDDGCGGSCGTCVGNAQCDSTNGRCECVPQCNGRSCGDDGCGGTCGPPCAGGLRCSSAGACEVCTPQCAGKNCGDDSCGGSCGSCGNGEICSAAGACARVPCDPVRQTGCGGGERCLWNGTQSVCAPLSAFGTANGVFCASEDCVAGSACITVGATQTCREYCRNDVDCGGNGKCAYDVAGAQLGVCANRCDPIAPTTGCLPGQGCYVLDTTRARQVFDCLEWGTGTTGSACVNADDCFTRYTCASSQCQRLCEVDADCLSGSCAAVPGWGRFGVCGP